MDEITFLFPAIEVWEWKMILSHTLECNYVSMLLLRWIHVNKIGPDDSFIGSVGNLMLITSAATTLLYIARLSQMVCLHFVVPDSKVHGANMGPTWVLSAPDCSPYWPHEACYQGCHAYMDEWIAVIHSARVIWPEKYKAIRITSHEAMASQTIDKCLFNSSNWWILHTKGQ